MAKMEKIGNMQTLDNKGDKFFCLPMISMPCTGYRNQIGKTNHRVTPLLKTGIL